MLVIAISIFISSLFISAGIDKAIDKLIEHRNRKD